VFAEVYFVPAPASATLDGFDGRITTIPVAARIRPCYSNLAFLCCFVSRFADLGFDRRSAAVRAAFGNTATDAIKAVINA
jgi:hypothetical protein